MKNCDDCGTTLEGAICPNCDDAFYIIATSEPGDFDGMEFSEEFKREARAGSQRTLARAAKRLDAAVRERDAAVRERERNADKA